METFIIIIVILVFATLTILMCYQESKYRRINFFIAILICLLSSPIIGYLIISSIKLRNPTGCIWCGNKENEAEYCGLCNKNSEGKKREIIN